MMRLVLSAILIAAPFFSFSWGKQGRHLVVTIAKGLLSEDAVNMVDYYLGTKSWTEASDWLENSGTPQNAPFRAQWHRVLVPKDKTYVPTKSPNLLNQIEYQLMVLEKKSVFPLNSVGEAIKTLFALLPEAHQPFHCGYTEDQGGSTIQVTHKGKKLNLLQLWDDELLTLRPCSVWDMSKLIMSMTSKSKSEIERAVPSMWITESRALLKDAYLLEADKGIVTDVYLDKSAEMAKQQLLKAGIRLGAILNKHFGG